MSVPLRVLLSPRMLALHALAVVVVTGTVLLGLWQLHAWQHRRDDTATSLANAAPRPLERVMGSDAAFPGDAVGRPVTVAGRWLPGSSLVVTDRTLHGRRGVWALTPVAVCDGGPSCAKAPAILVVRGWAPRASAVPAPPTGRVELTGWLQPGEGSGVTDPNPSDDVLPEVRIADAIQHVDQDLYGGYVIARTAAVSHGLEPVTPASLPSPSSFTALRNLLYALEWWVFGGFFVFLWWRWSRDEVIRVTGVPSNP